MINNSNYNLKIVDKMVYSVVNIQDTHNNLYTIIAAIFVGVAIVVVIVCWIRYRRKRKNIIAAHNEERNKFKASNKIPLTFDSEFSQAWFNNLIQSTSLVSADGCLQNLNNYQWVSGCYIIFNKSEHDKIYVGQSKNLALRVPQHFSNEGHGNKRIYNDYRGGDKFEIKIIPWKKDMPDLNRLEAGLIRTLKSDSYYGYNRSLGRGSSDKEIIVKRDIPHEWGG